MINNLIILLSRVFFLLFALVAFFSLILRTRLFNIQSERIRSVTIGSVFGLFGIINLVNAIELMPGIVIDLRSPLVIVAGFFSGGIGAFIAAGMVALYRIFGIGGPGLIGGSLAILSVAAMVTYWQRKVEKPTTRTWLLSGFVAVFISVFWVIATLPPEISQLFIMNFVPSALIMYPLLTLGLGTLISYEYRYVETQQALSISEQRARAIFEQAFQLIGLLTPDGRVIEANQTALNFARINASDISEKYFWDTPWWMHSLDVQDTLRASIEKAAQGETVRYRTTVTGHNQEAMVIDFSLTPIFNDKQQVIMLIPEGRDIRHELLAENRRIELQVERERSRILQDFISDSAHHLRTPVTILRTSQHMLSRNIKQVEKNQQTLSAAIEHDDRQTMNMAVESMQDLTTQLTQRSERIGKNIDILQDLIEDLLELSRLDHSETMIFQRIDLHELLSHLEHLYRDPCTAKGLTLTITLPDQPVFLHGDNGKLQLVFSNLLDNALLYTPAGGHIDVICVADDTVSISVQDTGIGIPPADQERIFERFYRADNARNVNTMGSGLGLAIVQKIIERHNGSITLDANYPHGTKINVSLPKVERTQSANLSAVGV